MAKTTKRIQSTVTEEMYNYIQEQRKKLSLSESAFVNLAISEYRQTRADKELAIKAFEKFKDIPPDMLAKMLQDELSAQ